MQRRIHSFRTREIAAGTLLIAGLAIAVPAHARNTEQLYKIEQALDSVAGKQRLLRVPLYFYGQDRPEFGKVVLEVSSEQTRRGTLRTDEVACQDAFLAAVVALQERAKQEKAAAIVDIVSITKGEKTESATEFRCIAGSTIVHVGLRGKLVAAR